MEEVAIIADLNSDGAYFAKGIYDYLRVKEGRGFSVSLIGLKITNFKDKEFKIKVEENIRGKMCFLIHDSNKEPCRWLSELAFILDALAFSSPQEINIILPYTRFARQDRKDESRVSVNAKVVANLISDYATRGMTIDLHTPQMQEYFSIPFDNLSSMPSLINYLKKNHAGVLQDLVIVSPDLGGGKRAEYLVKRLNSIGIKTEVAFGHKTREKDNEVAKTIVIGNVEGKNCLIIDDIIDTGNTMAKTAEVLREKGAKKIFAFATHGLFTEGIEKLKVFDKLLIGDTMKVPADGNLEVVSFINLFGEAIYRTVSGESLSVLFGDRKEDMEQKSLDVWEKI